MKIREICALAPVIPVLTVDKVAHAAAGPGLVCRRSLGEPGNSRCAPSSRCRSSRLRRGGSQCRDRRRYLGSARGLRPGRRRWGAVRRDPGADGAAGRGRRPGRLPAASRHHHPGGDPAGPALWLRHPEVLPGPAGRRHSHAAGLHGPLCPCGVLSHRRHLPRQRPGLPEAVQCMLCVGGSRLRPRYWRKKGIGPASRPLARDASQLASKASTAS